MPDTEPLGMTFDSELFELAGAREPKQRRLTRAQKRAGSQSCRQGQLKAAGNNEDAVTDKLEVNAREVKELQDSDETLEELRRLAENGDPRFIRKNSLLYRRERQVEAGGMSRKFRSGQKLVRPDQFRSPKLARPD